MNLASAFAQTAQRDLGKTAIYWGDRKHSYAELVEQTGRVAAHLQQDLGVKPGDRVALWLKNCPEFVPMLFGIFQAGGVAVPINNFLKAPEVSYILADAAIDVLITDAELAAALPELQMARPALRDLQVEKFAASAGPTLTSPPARSEEDLAVIIYTSGTTGRPKGAM